MTKWSFRLYVFFIICMTTYKRFMIEEVLGIQPPGQLPPTPTAI